MNKINIAIDGPSAAGKSTIADILAAKLDYVHLDTGAMYRCVAYKAIKEGIALDDEQGLSKLLKTTNIKMKSDGSIFLDGIRINDEIRTNEMSMAASDVSKMQVVRTFLVDLQQQMAAAKGIIMDGRDIGTVVLKDAEVKIFLTASADARAHRRFIQNQEKGIESDIDSLTKDIIARDYQDTHRKNSPLKKADDAIEVDSSNLSIEQVVDTIMDYVNKLDK